MLDDIYNKRILELAADIPRLGKLEAPHARASAVSKLCGSKVTVDLAMEDGHVSDFAHDVKACALGQASSSLMARNVIGSSAQELRDLRATMRAMLKENGPPPQGKWEELKVLEPVRDFKARHGLDAAHLRRRRRCDRPDRSSTGGGRYRCEGGSRHVLTGGVP